MQDPSIEEARRKLQHRLDGRRSNLQHATASRMEVERKNASDVDTWGTYETIDREVIAAYEDALQVLAPKPKPVKELLTWWIDLRRDEECVTSVTVEMILEDLKNEGYTLHHDGKPVQPKSSPVVDTGEDLKVQLAKQINTLAKLLEAEGLLTNYIIESLRTLDVYVGLLRYRGKNDAAEFASVFNQLLGDEYESAFERLLLPVLRDQFILSTDITQAIDRLNELVSIVKESEA